MRITPWIAARLARLRSLFSKKESIMSDQTVINPTSTIASSPAEDFANEVATPVAAPTPTAAPEVAPAVVAAAAPAEVPPATAPEAITAAPAQVAATAAPEAVTPAPAEVAPPSEPDIAAADAPPAAATAQSHDGTQAFSEGVKDFVRAFSFVEQGVIKLGDAAKDELIDLARKYL
jgi:hypothetical protein